MKYLIESIDVNREFVCRINVF